MTGTGTAANPGTGSHPSLPADGSALKSESRSWFTLSTSREERFFLLLAVFIGLFSGLAVVCFRLAIDWTRISLLGPAPEPHSWRLIATPTIVGLIVAVLVVHVFPLVRGQRRQPDQGRALHL